MQQHNRWIKIGLINFGIVALIGCIMRYKIGFDFPFLDQKRLLHSHSHYAFVAWVSHMLYTILTEFAVQKKSQKYPIYSKLIWFNLICAVGMVVGFMTQSYGPISITFSVLAILISYVFSYTYWNDLNTHHSGHVSTPWFKAALFFNCLSSIGSFILAWMMGTKHFDQNLYLASTYFYLHFQYSGWFFFGIMGILMNLFQQQFPSFKADPGVLRLFLYSCIPAYLLSVLWAHLPWYIYTIAVIAVVLQLLGLIKLIQLLSKLLPEIKQKWNLISKLIFAASFAALTIKLCLQAGSIFPDISKLAFGFRSIVIAYLHLVLLAFVSLFIVAYLYNQNKIPDTRASRLGIVALAIAVFLNEFVLMIQGVSSFSYTIIPFLNEILFGVSLLIFISVCFIIISSYRNRVQN